MASSASTWAVVTSFLGCDAGDEPLGLPARRRHPDDRRPEVHHDEVARRHDEEGLLTPTEVAVLKRAMSSTPNGAPTRAPLPNPMMANPVAIPGLSGNHFTSVETGAM